MRATSNGGVGTLILLCGLPGAGKTTYAKKLEVDRNAIRFSPDEWIEQILVDPLDMKERDRLRDPVENLQWEIAQTYLAKGLTVVLENGFWAEEERSAYAYGALELGAFIELYFFDITFEEQWRRIQTRNEALTSKTFVMTEADVEVGRSHFQSPTQFEMDFYDNFAIIKAAF